MKQGMRTMCSSILDRFPEKSEIIIALMARNAEFLGLCEDYEACMKAMRYWSQSDAPDADSRVREYCDLVRQLEKEIMRAVAEPELCTALSRV